MYTVEFSSSALQANRGLICSQLFCATIATAMRQAERAPKRFKAVDVLAPCGKIIFSINK